MPAQPHPPLPPALVRRKVTVPLADGTPALFHSFDGLVDAGTCDALGALARRARCELMPAPATGAALDVVTEQWAWLVDGAGVTLTASVARADYADYADLFEEVAATLAPLVRSQV